MNIAEYLDEMGLVDTAMLPLPDYIVQTLPMFVGISRFAGVDGPFAVSTALFAHNFVPFWVRN